MSIVYKSNGKHNRDVAKEYIRKQKAINPDFKVLDIGGASNPWCDELVDAYVDLRPIEGKKTYLRDIYSEELWNEIGQDYDFCICTHFLEDIRDPKFIIDKINKHFKAGFISIPNKHTELSNIESKSYLGYCHHRWIFTVDEDIFRAVAKMPVVNMFNPENKRMGCFKRWVTRKIFKKPVEILPPPLVWIDKSIATGEFELALIFENHLGFEIINNDYAGRNRDELITLYTEKLSKGL